MVFSAHPGIHLDICQSRAQQLGSAQAFDFLDVGKKSSFRNWKRGCTGKSFPYSEGSIAGGRDPGTTLCLCRLFLFTEML